MRWTRAGGFRSRLVARLTNGRFGLGRWTAGEVERIMAKANQRAKEFERYWD